MKVKKKIIYQIEKLNGTIEYEPVVIMQIGKWFGLFPIYKKYGVTQLSFSFYLTTRNYGFERFKSYQSAAENLNTAIDYKISDYERQTAKSITEIRLI